LLLRCCEGGRIGHGQGALRATGGNSKYHHEPGGACRLKYAGWHRSLSGARVVVEFTCSARTGLLQDTKMLPQVVVPVMRRHCTSSQPEHLLNRYQFHPGYGHKVLSAFK
jgi:hypothetical protein